jgi:hypothetical protein
MTGLLRHAYHPGDPTFDIIGEAPWVVTIKIISAQQLPAPLREDRSGIKLSTVVDPFVEVSLVGCSADHATVSTRVCRVRVMSICRAVG